MKKVETLKKLRTQTRWDWIVCTPREPHQPLHQPSQEKEAAVVAFCPHWSIIHKRLCLDQRMALLTSCGSKTLVLGIHILSGFHPTLHIQPSAF